MLNIVSLTSARLCLLRVQPRLRTAVPLDPRLYRQHPVLLRVPAYMGMEPLRRQTQPQLVAVCLGPRLFKEVSELPLTQPTLHRQEMACLAQHQLLQIPLPMAVARPGRGSCQQRHLQKQLRIFLEF